MFISLKNKTENENLRLALDNLKCTPDEKLNEAWKKIVETEPKTIPEEDIVPPQTGQDSEYDYYDESQLNGKLFYVDIRHLLNCTTGNDNNRASIKINQISKEAVTRRIEQTPKEAKHTVAPKYKSENITNRGVLDLSFEDATVKDTEEPRDAKYVQNLKEAERIPQKHTTGVAPVPPNIFKNTHYEDKDMASDEAASDKFLAHQRNHEYMKEEPEYKSSAIRSTACILLVIPLIVNL